MCGIVSYLGFRNAAEILHNALRKLTYRGYDSWGFCLKNGSKIFHVKDVGDIEKLKRIEAPFEANLGIAHTRWATTGKVSKNNAHPHFDEERKIAVVHNGIIENFQELKKELESKGHKFYSETDTEIVCHLIEEYMEEGNDFPEAVRKAFLRLKGRNAIVAMHRDFHGLVAIKRGSPLVVGIKDDGDKEEYFVASDVRAFVEETKKAVFLNDDEMVVVHANENN